MVGAIPTTDMGGQLRMTRTGTTVSGFYRSSSNSWAIIGSAPVSQQGFPIIVEAHTDERFFNTRTTATVAFNDLTVTADRISPIPVGQTWMSYFASDGVQPPACIPHAATAIPKLVNGFVVEIDVTDGGCGYTNAPVVEILGGGGTGAAAKANTSNGAVTSINVTDAGSGYTNPPSIFITSPPSAPWLDIDVSKVKVTQHMIPGKTYVLESSTDLANWNQIGPQFKAQAETTTQEFDVDVVGRYFRIRQVP